MFLRNNFEKWSINTDGKFNFLRLFSVFINEFSKFKVPQKPLVSKGQPNERIYTLISGVHCALKWSNTVKV